MRWGLLLPDIGRMIRLLSEHPGHFFSNWWFTFAVSFTASVLALFLALLISIIALRVRLVDLVLAPTVAMSQSFPLQAIAPIIIIVMGVGLHTKLSIAFVIAFFPIYSACLTALKTTPRPINAYLAICRAPFWSGVLRCRIPAALPALTSATKVGFTLAVLGAVVAEFIQPDRGLGHLILVAQSNYDVDVIYICVAFLLVQGLVVYGTLSYVEARLIANRRH